MNLLNRTLRSITPADIRTMKRAQVRLDNLTKPRGSLGKIEELAKNITGMTRKIKPPIKNKVIFTLASDHGVTQEGVSAFPKEVTAQMVYNFLRGGAAINVFAKHAGARVIIVDIGVCNDLIPGQKLINKKINYGTMNMAKGPAMSGLDAVKSIEIGIGLAEKEIDNGADICAIGEMGIGNSTSASAIAAVITRKSAESVTGYGTGVNDKTLKHKIRVIKQAVKVNQPDRKNAIDVLSKVGGFEIGGMAGIILACSAAKIPVVIDGFISSAAALIAYTLEPKCKEYMIASHCSQEKGHKIVLEHMGLSPLFDLKMRLGEGTGAAIGINMAELSLKMLNNMATFKSAKVSGRNK